MYFFIFCVVLLAIFYCRFSASLLSSNHPLLPTSEITPLEFLSRLKSALILLLCQCHCTGVASVVWSKTSANHFDCNCNHFATSSRRRCFVTYTSPAAFYFLFFLLLINFSFFTSFSFHGRIFTLCVTSNPTSLFLRFSKTKMFSNNERLFFLLNRILHAFLISDSIKNGSTVLLNASNKSAQVFCDWKVLSLISGRFSSVQSSSVRFSSLFKNFISFHIK